MDVTVIMGKNTVRDLPNLPQGIRVHIFDYDLEKYDYQEEDFEGNPCVTTIWTKATPDRKINYGVVLAVRNRQIKVVECSKGIRVKVIHEAVS